MLDIKQLISIPIYSEALQLVPQELAQRHRLLAVSVENDKLHVIIASHISKLAPDEEVIVLDEIRSVLNRDFTYDVALWEDLCPIIDFHYKAMPLSIQNCDVRFQLRCPKQWAQLTPTDQNTVRYCDECHQKVYFCNNLSELYQRRDDQQCVAFHGPDIPSFDVANAVVGRLNPRPMPELLPAVQATNKIQVDQRLNPSHRNGSRKSKSRLLTRLGESCRYLLRVLRRVLPWF